MKSSQAVYIRTLSQEELAKSRVLAGLTPQSMRKMLAVWMTFCVIVSACVVFAPGLSQNLVNAILAGLLVCTMVVIWQSRLNEGWPSLICDENGVGVVLEPHKRTFIFASYETIEAIESALLKPNKKALEIKVKPHKLCLDSKAALSQAMFPRDDRLLVHVYNQNRVEICRIIRTMMNNRTQEAA